MIERTAYTMMQDYESGIEDVDKRIATLTEERRRKRAHTAEYVNLSKRIASLNDSRIDMEIALRRLKQYYGGGVEN